MALFFWVPTKRNPADRPSRVWARSTPRAMDLAQPGAVWEVLLLSPGMWAQRGLLAVALCSGVAQEDDWSSCMVRKAGYAGVLLIACRVDPAVESCRDLTDDTFFHSLLDLCHQGQVCCVLSSPPCSTISRVRHVPLAGRNSPRPLRSRENVWRPLAYCSSSEVQQCLLGSLLALRCFAMLYAVMRAGGLAMHEHPAHPGMAFAPFFFIPRL